MPFLTKQAEGFPRLQMKNIPLRILRGMFLVCLQDFWGYQFWEKGFWIDPALLPADGWDLAALQAGRPAGPGQREKWDMLWCKAWPPVTPNRPEGAAEIGP